MTPKKNNMKIFIQYQEDMKIKKKVILRILIETDAADTTVSYAMML